MSTMSKTLLAVLVGILVGGAAYVMAAPADKSSSTPGTPAAATGSTSTVDVSGPCDEAEHVNDPRCAGSQRPEDADDRDGLDDDRNHDVGDDHGGLRHEAEPGDDSNRGPGSRNSGPGSSHSDDGPGHDAGDDHGGHADDGPDHDLGDDHGGSGGSGSGSSGSDDSGSGSSGSGHSGSDD